MLLLLWPGAVAMAGGDEDCTGGESACCINGDICYCMTQLMCNIWGGVFHPGQDCSDVTCDYGCGGFCDEGETEDCNGSCFPSEWIGDGICDNGWRQWDTNTIYLECEAFGWDGGDCTPTGSVPTETGACCIGDQSDCSDRTCMVLSFWDCTLNDGVFLGEQTSCTDAQCTCPPGMVADCQGNCFSLYLLGDGVCQEGVTYWPPGDDPNYQLNLGCLELGCDGGDCIGVCAGACCLGTDCMPDLNVIECADVGGVFLGSASACTGVDCSDHLSPLVLSSEADTPYGEDNGAFANDVAAGGGLLVASVYGESVGGSQYPAAYIYDDNGTLLARVVGSSETSNFPLVDTDGSRVVLAVHTTAWVYDVSGMPVLEDTITIGGEILGVAVSGGRIAIWDHEAVQLHERVGAQWLYDDTVTPEYPLLAVDLDGDVLAIADLVRLTVWEPAGLNWGRSEFWSISGSSAAVSVSGDRVLLGESADVEEGNPAPSQARIFAKSMGVWVQESTLVPVNVNSDDLYGHRVGLDGDLAVVSAVNNDEHGFNCGMAIVFERVDGGWAQTAKLVPDDAVSDMHYGSAVAVNQRSIISGWQRRTDLFTVYRGVQIGRVPTSMWTSSDGGSIDDADNWAHGAPSSGEAMISVPAAFGITVGGPLPMDELKIGPSRPTLRGADATLGSGDGLLSIEGTQSYTAHLTLATALSVEGDVTIGAPRRPGALTVTSDGGLDVTGSLIVNKTGTIEFQIGGDETMMIVGGAFDCEGVLSVSVADGADDPAVGSVFPLLSCTAAPGAELSVPVLVTPGLGAGKFFAIEQSASAGEKVVLSLVVQSVEGLNDLGDPTETTVSGTATDIVVADLTSQDGDLDGYDDIALTVAGEPGYVTLLINDGAGGIVQQVAYEVSANPTSIDAGDFADDGYPDLVFAFHGAGEMQTIDFAAGNAVDFEPGPVTTTGDGPVDLAVMRFDGDDYDDVVVACAGDGTLQPDGTYYGELEFFDSDGPAVRGSFSKTQSVLLEEMPGQVKPGGVGAGKGSQRTVVSLLTVNELLLLGDDGGLRTSFSELQRITVGSEPDSVVMGDLNGDGFDDALVANSGSNTVSILLGVDVWELGEEQVLTCGDSPSSLTLLDYDGDDDLDVAVLVLDESGDPMVSVYRNDTDSTSGSLVLALEETISDSIQLVGAGRIDGDATDDLVTVTNGLGFRGAQGEVGTRVSDGATVTPCPGDLTGDGLVNIDDLLEVISAWGTPDGDTNGDGEADVDDILLIIGAWGGCA